MSASVSFAAIPPNLRVPLVSVEFDNSQAGANQTNQVALLIGGTLISQPMVPVLGVSVAMVRAMFGRGSMLARMYENYVANDNIGTVYLLPVPDPAAGVAAVGSQNVAYAALTAGVLSTYVGGQLISTSVAVGDATNIAANIVAAAALLPDLPATPTNNGSSTVTWTAKHKGLSGNSIDIRMNYQGIAAGEAIPSGLSVAIVEPTGGAADPDLSTLDAMLGNVPYDFIGSGYTSPASLTAIKTVLANRWGPLRQVYGHAFAAYVATETALVTEGGTVNDPHTTLFGYYDSPTPPWEATAQILGTVAPALKADAARPVQTLQLTGFSAPPSQSRFNTSQKQALLTNGIALLSHDQAGDTFILRAVTTYQSNAFGQADQSYLDCETLYTLMAVQRQLTSAVAQKFPRSKVADDGTAFGAGQPIVTPKIMKAEIIAQYQSMVTDGLVEDADAMATATIVVRNSKDPGRLDALFVPYLIQGLRVVAMKNQFRLFSALADAAA